MENKKQNKLKYTRGKIHFFILILISDLKEFVKEW